MIYNKKRKVIGLSSHGSKGDIPILRGGGDTSWASEGGGEASKSDRENDISLKKEREKSERGEPSVATGPKTTARDITRVVFWQLSGKTV